MNIKKFLTVISIAVLLAACTTPETIEKIGRAHV